MGSGSGYLVACFAEVLALAQPASSSSRDGQGRGKDLVIGIEHIQELADLGASNMRKSERGRHLLEKGTVGFVKGDGRKGWKVDGGEENGEFWDVIHVGAAASEIHPELVSQLRRPGR